MLFVCAKVRCFSEVTKKYYVKFGIIMEMPYFCRLKTQTKTNTKVAIDNKKTPHPLIAVVPVVVLIVLFASSVMAGIMALILQPHILCEVAGDSIPTADTLMSVIIAAIGWRIKRKMP